MYYFIGIKGTGMSSLACILQDIGYQVMGSDVDKHFFTEAGLIKRNIKILTYNPDNIKSGLTIIKGASIKEDNPELIKARSLNLEIINYNDMVGRLTTMYKTICVAGCHGKTTTTAMIKQVLDKEVGLNYLIGDGTGNANKDNKYFALESCEYRRHFLAYTPYYAIILNIDLDHVDYFKNMDDVILAYQEFIDKTTNIVIANGDDSNILKLHSNKRIVYFGLNDNNNIQAKNIIYHKDGITFDVIIDNKLYHTFNLPLYGKHQLLDALSVITLCYLENINKNNIEKHLKEFKGAKRRFNETIIKDNIIIDDYAHHYTEVKATIEAIKQKYAGKDIIAIFQPHTYSRTKQIKDDLVDIFKTIKAAYILDIHPAREKQEDYPGITSDLIIDKLDNGYHINMDEAFILTKYKNSVFVFMSPNDLSKLENDLIKLLQ